jgi:hypothetical protein
VWPGFQAIAGSACPGLNEDPSRLALHAPRGAGLMLGHQTLQRPSGVRRDEEATVAAEDNRQLARIVRGLRHREDALGLPGQIPLPGFGGCAFDPKAHNCLIARAGGFLTAPRSRVAVWVFVC